MAVFLVGMSAGSGYMWKEALVYAAEAVFETDEGQKDGYQIDVLTDEIQNSDVDIIMDETELPNEAELLDEAELPDNALPRTGSEDSEKISDNLFENHLECGIIFVKYATKTERLLRAAEMREKPI